MKQHTRVIGLFISLLVFVGLTYFEVGGIYAQVAVWGVFFYFAWRLLVPTSFDNSVDDAMALNRLYPRDDPRRNLS